MTRHTQILVLDADAVLERLERLEAAVLRLQPQEPVAIPLEDYAKQIGRTVRTVNRMIAAGEIVATGPKGRRKIVIRAS